MHAVQLDRDGFNGFCRFGPAGERSAGRGNGVPAESDSALGARTYKIRDFGAKGDGKTLDTTAVQAAIEACNRDRGGTVLVPGGVFVIGTVEMTSNVTLRIAAQGKLLMPFHHETMGKLPVELKLPPRTCVVVAED